MPVPAATAYELTLGQYRSQSLIEAAGLFWLLAEVLILFAMTVACDYLRRGAVVPFQWESAYTRRLAIWIIAFALLSMAILGRHLIWPPAHTVIDTLSADALRVLVAAREQTHLIIWAVFVLGWVLLEAAIVFYGIRAFRMLRDLLRPAEGGRT